MHSSFELSSRVVPRMPNKTDPKINGKPGGMVPGRQLTWAVITDLWTTWRNGTRSSFLTFVRLSYRPYCMTSIVTGMSPHGMLIALAAARLTRPPSTRSVRADDLGAVAETARRNHRRARRKPVSGAKGFVMRWR